MKRCALLILLFAAPVWFASGENFPLRDDGSIPVWLAAGSLPYNPPQDKDEKLRGGFYKDFLKAQGGEKKYNPSENERIEFEAGKSVAWIPALCGADGSLDFNQIFNENWLAQGVAYAYCQLNADADKDVLLKVRSNDGVRVWVNDSLVLDNHAARRLDQGEDRVQTSLKKGANRILAKVDQLGGGWGLILKAFAGNGKRLEGVSTSVPLKEPLKNHLQSASFSTKSLILNTPEGERQILAAEIVSGGMDDVVFHINSVHWDKPLDFPIGAVPMGAHRFEFKIPPTADPLQATIQSSNEKKTYDNITIAKPRHWTVYLVQHTHTDIGYTRPQTEILPEHLRYIDYALDYCDLTDNYPDDAKFRWTCETSWAVREYLKRRPAEQIERLKQRVKEGRIEIAGMFLNMAEIADEASLAASLQPIRTIHDDFGIPVRSALQNDVNGAAWCLVDYFSGMGLEYLSMGINKTRSLLPFDRPTPFWWESPSGNRILAYRPDHYMTGNTWQIHTGNIEAFKTGILDYFNYLTDREYPFDRVAVQFSGYSTDNSPPAMIECDLVKKWNETYAWPKLRLATAHEFLDYVKQNHADELPTLRQAWPDWWTDGFGSAARETAASRNTHADMRNTGGLFAIASLLGASIQPAVMDRAAEVFDDLLFYDEHTYGAAESIDDPLAENSMTQWGEKSSYVWEAVKKARLLQEEAFGLAQDFLPRLDVSSIAVFNTLNWPRSGLIDVFIDHEILPKNREFRLVDGNGKPASAQALSSRSEGTYWAIWAEDVPPLGYKIYRLELGGPKASPEADKPADLMKMENEFYAITLNPDTGAIRSLIDKTDGRELVDGECQWGLGQIIYETLAGGREFQRDAFKRTTLRNVKIENGASGPIWDSRLLAADADGCANPNGVRCEIRLFRAEKRIELHYSLRKLPVTSAEAVYAAFPFNRPQSKIVYEAQGGYVTPGENQIPRSSSDWQTIQNFASVRDQNSQIIFVSGQAPLVQFGDINLGKWQETAVIEKPYIYSWVMNNYWFTNFRASQEGEFLWNYAITSTKDSHNAAASRFGWSARVPLASRVLPSSPSPSQGKALALSTLNLDVSNLLLVDAHPARYGQGIILQLREVEGEIAALDFKDSQAPIRRIDEVNVLEESIKQRIKIAEFRPYEVKFLKVSLKK